MLKEKNNEMMLRFWGLKFELYLLVGLFCLLSSLELLAGDTLTLKSASKEEVYELSPYVEGIEETENINTLEEALKVNEFIAVQKLSPKADKHWLKFTLQNPRQQLLPLKLAITFTDSIEFYYPINESIYQKSESGELFPISKRAVPLGEIIMFNLSIPPESTQTFYIRLKGKRSISKDFRGATFNTIRLYTPSAFEKRFEKPRIYQAIFYGAILIMLFYNVVIFISLRDKSYLYYTFYITLFLIFLAANSGYLLELVFPNAPYFDLPIRMLSAPILVSFYLLFGQTYLKLKEYSPKWDKVFSILQIVLVVVAFFMLIGFWKYGRIITILVTVPSFLLLLFSAFKTYQKGYSPALYLIIANVLVILGGIVFALPRLIGASIENPFTQYSLQGAFVIELALFSIGLADRINLAQRQLNEEKLEKERLQRQQEQERQALIEQKNKELEQKVIERTAEVVKQKEKTEKANKHLTDSIQYAKRIQEAVITDVDKIQKAFPNSFILYRPKDIVSGDFYWFEEVEVPNIVPNDTKLDVHQPFITLKILVVADCTGHGVPGAFMTVLGSSLLDEIILEQRTVNPSKLLQTLDYKILDRLQNEDSKRQVRDGMDLSVFILDETNQQIQITGAKNSVYKVQNDNIEEIKTSSFAIGGFQDQDKTFPVYTFPVRSGDTYFLYSDGYQDQFGGEKGRKFLKKRFRELLKEISPLPPIEQKTILEQKILAWQGEEIQTDDILVVGIQV